MLPLQAESWIWYAVTVLLIFARLGSRYLNFGSIKKLQLDDWLMVFVVATYTTFMVTINIVAHENSNLLPPGFDMSTLTPDDVKDREYGSKLVLVVEQCQIVTIWAVKACLVLMYLQLSFAMKEHILVKCFAVYIAVGFVVMEILYFGVWCRPFSNYWAVPTPNTQCNAATNHLITNAVLNISSDLAMLVLALQMIIRTSLPWLRKAILCIIFGLAVFSILSAVLNKYYSFTEPFGSLWTFWYVRESSTATLVANLPFTWTLLRRMFKLAAFDPNAYASSSSHHHHSQRTAAGRRNHTVVIGRHKRDGTGGGSITDSVIDARSKNSGHRGGGRSATSGGHKARVPSSSSHNFKKQSEDFELHYWMDDRSDAGDRSPPLRCISPMERALLPPERIV